MKPTDLNIPDRLYRGDDDKAGIRKLRTTIQYNQFQTNLVNGGEGRLIFESPLSRLIEIHVGIGWEKTHFLSFTEDVHIAYKFGTRNQLLTAGDMENGYSEFVEGGDNWKFALMTLHTDLVDWSKLDHGVYQGLYKPSLEKFKITGLPYRVILMDVKTILNDWKHFDASFSKAFANAVRDKEWLLLPATFIQFNAGRIEFSAIIDGACMSSQKIATIQ